MNLQSILQKLESTRLLTFDGENYELSHDTLARKIAEKRSAEEKALIEWELLIKNKLRASAQAVSPDYLTAAQLTGLTKLEHKLFLDKEEKAFVAASRKYVAEQERKAKMRRRLILGGVSVFAFVMLFAAIFSYQQYQQAQKEKLMSRLASLNSDASLAKNEHRLLDMFTFGLKAWSLDSLSPNASTNLLNAYYGANNDLYFFNDSLYVTPFPLKLDGFTKVVNDSLLISNMYLFNYNSKSIIDSLNGYISIAPKTPKSHIYLLDSINNLYTYDLNSRKIELLHNSVLDFGYTNELLKYVSEGRLYCGEKEKQYSAVVLDTSLESFYPLVWNEQLFYAAGYSGLKYSGIYNSRGEKLYEIDDIVYSSIFVLDSLLFYRSRKAPSILFKLDLSSSEAAFPLIKLDAPILSFHFRDRKFVFTTKERLFVTDLNGQETFTKGLENYELLDIKHPKIFLVKGSAPNIPSYYFDLDSLTLSKVTNDILTSSNSKYFLNEEILMIQSKVDEYSLYQYNNGDLQHLFKIYTGEINSSSNGYFYNKTLWKNRYVILATELGSIILDLKQKAITNKRDFQYYEIVGNHELIYQDNLLRVTNLEENKVIASIKHDSLGEMFENIFIHDGYISLEDWNTGTLRIFDFEGKLRVEEDSAKAFLTKGGQIRYLKQMSSHQVAILDLNHEQVLTLQVNDSIEAFGYFNHQFHIETRAHYGKYEYSKKNYCIIFFNLKGEKIHSKCNTAWNDITYHANYYVLQDYSPKQRKWIDEIYNMDHIRIDSFFEKGGNLGKVLFISASSYLIHDGNVLIHKSVKNNIPKIRNIIKYKKQFSNPQKIGNEDRLFLVNNEEIWTIDGGKVLFKIPLKPYFSFWNSYYFKDQQKLVIVDLPYKMEGWGGNSELVLRPNTYGSVVFDLSPTILSSKIKQSFAPFLSLQNVLEQKKATLYE